MNKLITLFILTLMSPMLFACATTRKEVTTLPPFKPAEATLTKRLYVKETTAVPIEPTLTFTTEDSEAISYVKLKNLSGEHRLRWDWIGPEGEIYSSSGDYSLKTSRGRYKEEVVAWHKLSIRGDRASRSTGDWQIRVYLDDALIIQKDFIIETDVETVPEITGRPDFKSWGLIIGIERYPSLPSVDYAEDDARLIKGYFTNILGIPDENIIYLTGSEATKSRIRGYLRSYIPKNAESDTTLYVYYAGHGLPYPEGDRIEPYLLPYDSDTKTITETGYKLQDFYNDLAGLPVKRTFVFMDTCFSGAAASGDKMLIAGARPVYIAVENQAMLSGKVITLTSSSGSEISNSYPEKAHGLFTYFLLKGLRGEADTDSNGSLNIGELYTYVRENVNKLSKRKGMEQTPEILPSLNMLRDIEISKVPENNPP